MAGTVYRAAAPAAFGESIFAKIMRACVPLYWAVVTRDPQPAGARPSVLCSTPAGRRFADRTGAGVAPADPVKCGG